jgi:hypothetical protein
MLTTERTHRQLRPRIEEPVAKGCGNACRAVHMPAGGSMRAGRTPVGILRAADAMRQQELVPLRYGRMLQSPFTFYRGSAGVMAADLAATPATWT